MNTSNSVTLIVAIVTAAIALIGYWNTQHLLRRDRRGRLFADAMAAIYRYEQTPHRVRRRKDSSQSTRGKLAKEISSAAASLNLNIALLDLDAPIIGDAYRLIVEQTAPAVRKYRNEAWESPPIEHDQDVPGTAVGIKYENSAARDLCLKLMRQELGIGGFTRHRSMRRQIHILREARKQDGL